MSAGSKIRVLSDDAINKIAAGEVIENPASVVKELVENSLDAGATEICIEIKGGGRQLIRISDNGCGMTADDAILCLERHATSKIRSAEDLESLLTMGFRGEALPSIAAVSKFTLLTCLRDESKTREGTMVIVEGGKIHACSKAARSPGTTIEVKSLFYNVPARRKFQKSPSSDSQEVLKAVTLLSLGHPHIHFEMISDQKSVLKTTINQQLGARIETVLGKSFFQNSLPLSFSREPYQLTGYIGLPSQHRPNKTGQTLFLNNRTVVSPFISFAVKEGYGTTLPPNRYPVFVLHLSLPCDLVDVNVHPQKKEVRLRQEQHLKASLIQAVQEALQQHHFDEQPVSFLLPIISSGIDISIEEPAVSSVAARNDSFVNPLVTRFSPTPSNPSRPLRPPAESPTLFEAPAIPARRTTPRILTTLASFILVDPNTLSHVHFPALASIQHGGLCLVDQKAAHARIHYERLLSQLRQPGGRATAVQSLLLPLTIEVSPQEAALLEEHLEAFNKMGFGIHRCGPTTFMVDAIPELMRKEDLQSTLIAIAHDLCDLHDGDHLQREREKRLALAACRASMPPDRLLTHEEAQKLMEQLIDCESPQQCPFGKPTLVHLSSEELTKQFFLRKG